MNANARNWVKGLREGRRPQGRGALKMDKAGTACFCLLGMACEDYAESPEGKAEGFHAEMIGIGMWEYDGTSRFFLPLVVMKWLGLRQPDGAHVGGDLVWLSDIARKSFADAADLIESEPEELFVVNS